MFKINWRKGSADMIELTITMLGLIGFAIIFIQILVSTLGLISMENAAFEISRKIVVCESLDDEDDPDNANKVADELVKEYFKNSNTVTDVSAYVTMAETETDSYWKKGNFATLHIQGTPTYIFPMPYNTVSYTFMIEGG